MISVDELTKPFVGEDPCGEDLSKGSSLVELDALILGKPENQFRAAEPPDWRKVRQTCLELFGRSRDLRVSVALCLALMCTEGLQGLRDGLSALRTLLEKYWIPLHPKLRPEDNNDPLERMNTIAALAVPLGTYGDPFRFIERLQTVVLTNSPRIGKFTFGELTEARGAPAKGAARTGGIDAAQIEAAFRDTAPEEVQTTFQNAQGALDQLRAIDGFLRSSVGAVHAPNLSELEKSLSAIQDIVGPYAKSATLRPGDAPTPGTPAQTSGGSNGKGPISSREDVLRVLGEVRSFYAKHEPASPIPLLIRRVERMVPMSFLEILKEVSPDSIKELTKIVGPQPE